MPNPTDNSAIANVMRPLEAELARPASLGGTVSNSLTVGTGPASILIQHTKSIVLLYADLAAAVFAMLVSFFTANFVRTQMNFPPFDPRSEGFTFHLVLIGIFTVGLFVWFGSRGHYRRRETLAVHLAAILSGCAMAMVGAAAIQFATIEVGSRVLTMSYWGILAPSLMIGRLLARQFLRATRLWTSRAVLFTPASRATEVTRLVRKHDELGVRIENRISTDRLSAAEIVDMMRRAARSGSVAIYAPEDNDTAYHDVVNTLILEGIPFILSPHIGPLPAHVDTHNYPLEDVSFLDVRDPLARPMAMALKRSMDVLFAAFFLVLSSPALLFIAISTKMDGGPVMFRQKRVGRNGEIFDCLKFRTMVVNAEEKLQQMIDSDPEVAAEWKAYQKLKKDPRITWVGRFVRKANLDELPQLINILAGDMSLVGPRPMIVSQIEEYGAPITAYCRMRPGITGIWQTNGRNQTTFTERARLDAWYVRNWSLWRDFVILVRTVREVFFARSV